MISALVQICFGLGLCQTSDNGENTVPLSIDASLVSSKNDFDVSSFSKHGFGKHGSSVQCIGEENDNHVDKNIINDNNGKTSNPYEDESMINSYKHFHFYNGKYFGVSNFPQSVANFALEIANNQSIKFDRAMDIGCAVGRISFELSQHFNFVQGIDFSHEMIDVARSVQNKNNIVWYMVNEGDIYDKFETNVERLFNNSFNNGAQCNENKSININISNINFSQNDALNLDAKYDNFNLIVASNLIDRLSDPHKFLINIKERLLNDNNSILVICTPYTWLEQYTSKSKWLGGKYKLENNTNEILTPVFGNNRINDILSQWFDLIKEKNIEMVFRETKWEYIHSISHCTGWRKRN